MKDQSTPGRSAVRVEEIEVFDEDGALSHEFLRHRGYCCENGCRNCPYDFRDKMKISQRTKKVTTP